MAPCRHDDLQFQKRPVARQGGDLDTAAVQTFVSERLADYKVPRTVEFVDTPLRDDAGKARRSAVRDEVIARLRP